MTVSLSQLISNHAAVIQEETCIGCTKCIQACPVDAIIGAAKCMHTVLQDICIGCGLCLPPCPVDCIELIVTTPLSPDALEDKLADTELRFSARNKRLKKLQKPILRNATQHAAQPTITLADVQAAVSRAQARKKEKGYGVSRSTAPAP